MNRNAIKAITDQVVDAAIKSAAVHKSPGGNSNSGLENHLDLGQRANSTTLELPNTVPNRPLGKMSSLDPRLGMTAPVHTFVQKNRNCISQDPAPKGPKGGEGTDEILDKVANETNSARALCARYHKGNSSSRQPGRSMCKFCCGAGFEAAEKARSASNQPRNEVSK